MISQDTLRKRLRREELWQAAQPPRNRGVKKTEEGWEPTLREQIKRHPRISLGIGLLAGILAGWWVKR